MFLTTMKVLGPTEQPKSAIHKRCSLVKFLTSSFSVIASLMRDIATSERDFYIRPKI